MHVDGGSAAIPVPGVVFVDVLHGNIVPRLLVPSEHSVSMVQSGHHHRVLCHLPTHRAGQVRASLMVCVGVLHVRARGVRP